VYADCSYSPNGSRNLKRKMAVSDRPFRSFSKIHKPWLTVLSVVTPFCSVLKLLKLNIREYEIKVSELPGC